MTILRVRRIELASAAKFGFVSGVVSAIPAAAVMAILIRFVISWLRRTLEGWQHASLDITLVGKVPMDMVRLLNLNNMLTDVQRLDQVPAIVVIAVFVMVVLIAGSVTALFNGWQAMAYNSMAAMSGGLMVQVDPEDGARTVILKRH